VIVRRADPADFPAIAALTVAAYRADGQLDGDLGYVDELADVASRASAGEVLVAVDAGAVLGAVTLVRPGSPYSEQAVDGEFEFRMLAVDPAAHRRGAGQALVVACVERARAAGAEALVIRVRDFAENARRLYTRLGFVRVPEHDWDPYPGVSLLALRLPLVEAS
jgi:ribosomal protein S18 acetylase RimI-like enzyme